MTPTGLDDSGQFSSKPRERHASDTRAGFENSFACNANQLGDEYGNSNKTFLPAMSLNLAMSLNDAERERIREAARVEVRAKLQHALRKHGTGNEATIECRGCHQRVSEIRVSKSNGCCERCLAAVMRAASDGRCTSEEEDRVIATIGGNKAATYGEITPLGLRALAARLHMSEADTFADLGSGLGRAVS